MIRPTFCAGLSELVSDRNVIGEGRFVGDVVAQSANTFAWGIGRAPRWWALVALIFAFPSPGSRDPRQMRRDSADRPFFVRRWGGGISIARGFGSLVFFASLAMTACAWIAVSLAPEQEFWRMSAGALLFGGCTFVLCGRFIEAGGAFGEPGHPPPYFGVAEGGAHSCGRRLAWSWAALCGLTRRRTLSWLFAPPFSPSPFPPALCA